jgi:hypothetical protein
MPIVLNGTSGDISGSSLTGIDTGKILQVVSTTLTTVSSNSTAAEAIWSYNDSALKATITAANASNKFLIMGSVVVGSNGLAVSSILQDGGSNLTGAVGTSVSSRKASTSGDDTGSTEGVFTLSYNVVLTAGDTNAHNFHYAFWHNAGSTQTLYLNRSNDDSDHAKRGRYISNITVMEVAA